MLQSDSTQSHHKIGAAEILEAFTRLPTGDAEAVRKFRTRDTVLTKPPGSLGRLESLASWMAEWQGHYPPRAEKILTLVFAGNHGVVAQGVAAYPQAVTAQMVANFAGGGAAINQICKTHGLDLVVIPLCLDHPTGDMTQVPAMSESEINEAMTTRWHAIPFGADLVCIGEMGIGNTTIAAALCCALFGGDPSAWVGPGTGVDAAGVARKADAVARALALHRMALNSPLDILRHLGGRELAAMFAAVISARMKRVPVLIDGYVASAAAAIAHAINSSALSHCQIAHCSAEPGHRLLAEELGKTPIVDLGMRLGEASGAAPVASIVRAAVNLHNGMATFESANVSNKS